MVSAMMAITASVSPNCQETRIENATKLRTATTIRSRQTRILGCRARWARFPRYWPMPGGVRLAPSTSSTGVTTAFHSDLGGSSWATGSSARSSDGTDSSYGDQSHNARSADSGSAGATSTGTASTGTASTGTASTGTASTGTASTGTNSTPAIPSSTCPGQTAGASGTGSAGPRAEPPEAPCGAPPCDRVPSCAAPLRLLPVIGGPDDLFLSFGHAIRYHPPPQRNCLRTQRKAPSLRRLCPTPAGFIAGHLPRQRAKRPGLAVVYDLLTWPRFTS